MSFNLDWDRFVEEYWSQLKGEYGKEDEPRINFLLNYELLASIAAPLEDTIYWARLYIVDTVPIAYLLREIKMNLVREAVHGTECR